MTDTDTCNSDRKCFNSEEKCCYDFTKKQIEFLHDDTYMLNYKNSNKKEENIDRMKIFYNKFFQPYYSNEKEKIKDKKKYFDIFGIIPLELIPASYLPFNYKNYDMNLDRLKNGNKFFEDDYKEVFFDYDKTQAVLETTNYIDENDLKEYLMLCLKDKLNNPKSIFNAYSINTMAIILIILWFFIISMLLYILFYYYRDIYTYILLFITVILVLFAIIWKMIYILNIE